MSDTFQRYRCHVTIGGQLRLADVDIDINEIATLMSRRAANSPQQKASAMFGAVKIKLLPETATPDNARVHP